MLEELKKLAFEKLEEKMESNSLDSNNTNAAAQEGADSFISNITERISSGGFEQITDLFSGSNDGIENNGLFDSVKNQFSGILESKGMDRVDAEREAGSVLPDLVSNLKDKFMSKDESDKGFDLSALSNLTNGDLGNVLNKAKGFFN